MFYLFNFRIQSIKRRPLFDRLQHALHMEDLTCRDAVMHLSIDEAKIEGIYPNYYVKISNERERQITAERYKQMTLLLVPMDKFRKKCYETND